MSLMIMKTSTMIFQLFFFFFKVYVGFGFVVALTKYSNGSFHNYKENAGISEIITPPMRFALDVSNSRSGSR